MKHYKSKLAAVAGAGLLAINANALVITSETDAMTLWNAVAGGIDGITLNSIMLSGQSAGGAISTGTYSNGSGTYGIGDGIVLSSGDVQAYGDGANTAGNTTTDYGAAATAAQETTLDGITGGGFDHFDVTELTINFDADVSVDTIFFNLVFGSEEFSEFVGSNFIDGFGIFLNGVNETLVGGFPININHPDMATLPGTELDGVLAPGGNPLLTFALAVTPGSIGNVLTFIIADTSDGVLDSTVYISGFGSVDPTGVPSPGTLLLLGAGLLGMRQMRRTKR